ncbi:Regulating synaptic membrane exocytosis protein 1 [Cricetulus griseus]|uniref:Regulating synaptic membrane exocytosis protein 1 n=1 Tax=Cricetulus griseus TaxID=10029 RepID=G3GUE5_CRIGR|nr:Regulating synaptic membrane exocytosis protein 1 [Cricetulus griseus]
MFSLFAELYTSYIYYLVEDRKKAPGLSEQNGKGGLKSERKRVPKSAVQPGEGTAEERERKERRETRRLERGRSQDYPDRPEKREDGRAAEDEKQRKEEEYQTSSEEEGVSTPEYTSCEDVELESESVSEKGERGSEVKMRADACRGDARLGNLCALRTCAGEMFGDA